jgi:excisionase family DNA binding protein
MNDFDNLSEKSGASVPATERVPIYRKLTLTIREAAEYSNIGINKIDAMLKAPNCPFVLFVGTKKLVKRCEFEEYIREKLVI